jgi:FkbM family methyltransferase
VESLKRRSCAQPQYASLAGAGSTKLRSNAATKHQPASTSLLIVNPSAILSRLRNEAKPVRFVVCRALLKSGLSRAFVVQRAGYRVRFHPSAVSAQAWLDPSLTNAEERFVARTLRPGDCYIDVGANVGLLALRAGSIVGPMGQVIAIEAHPRTFSYLADNVQLNGFSVVRPIHSAVGEGRGTLHFTDVRSDDQNHVVPLGQGGFEVSVRPLDELVPPGPIALLKVDVEGFELPVFRGATNVLSRSQVILFESWDRHAERYGYHVSETLSVLRAAGFRAYRLHEDSLSPIGDDHTSPACENLVARRE